MSEVLVRVEGVSKKFCRSLKKSLWYGLQDLGREIAGGRHGGDGKLRPDEFWAVKDVSFELRRGECLALIGRNGAGKTTLLKILNGLIKPDGGKVEMRGRVGGLIALGAGFNPILTGRENIYINASVLGLSKREIDEKLDDILDFAEIGEFIDMPVQSYSSGMTVRLGFATASVLEPDILLLDEVLAVGDAAFKYKCYRRIDQLLAECAVIFVSHDMPNIARICNQGLLLGRGSVKYMGAILGCIAAYESENQGKANPEAGQILFCPPVEEIIVQGLPYAIAFNAPLRFEVTVRSEEDIGNMVLRIYAKDMAGNYVASCVVESADYGIELAKGSSIWNIELSSLPLKAGHYLIGLTLSDEAGALKAVWHDRHRLSIEGGHIGMVGACQLEVKTWIKGSKCLEVPA